MSDAREQIRRHVDTNPGVHFNELVRTLDVATGQAQYHIDRLLDADRLDAERLRGRTHYFTAGYDAWERRVIALLRRETAREIIVRALDAERVSATELTEELDVARSTVSWHVSTLVEAGVATKEYDAQGRAHVRVTRPDEVRALLGEVSPSLPDKLVDRFTRLIDASFYG